MDRITVDRDLIKSFPIEIMRKYNMIPEKILENKLLVYVEKIDEIYLELLKLYFDYEIELVEMDLLTIERKIREREDSILNSNLFRESESIMESGSVRLFNEILNYAVSLKATDIHIESYEESNRIRFRINGRLKEVDNLNYEEFQSLSVRIKILSNLDITETRKPQDGRIILKLDRGDVDVRISSIPTIFGEKFVLRLLDKDNFTKDINSLGITGEQLSNIKKLYRQPYGMILITGPAGSGKTTSLYAILNELNDSSKNITTIEDPIEYTICGINQTQVNRKTDYTFHKAFESVLRQDPNIIVLGEIRNEKICKLALQSAITGHLILSTIHTNSTMSTITRLRSMKIEDYLIREGIVGIISQRLIGVLCPKCKVEYVLSKEEQENLDLKKEGLIYRAKGCSHCIQGYVGRKLLVETLVFDKKIKAYLESYSPDELECILEKDRFQSIKEQAKLMVIEGETSMEEYFKVSLTV